MHVRDRLSEILQKLTSQYEGSELEFKSASKGLPKSFWETYSSFANTSGGLIVLGISEKPKFEVTGVTDPQKIISNLCDIANNKDKVNINIIENRNIETHSINGKSIIAVYIPEVSPSLKPVYLNGNPKYSYIRKNEGDYIASTSDLRRFIRDSSDDLDSELLDNYTLSDLNTNSILAFKNIINARTPSRHYLEMDNLDFLTEMGVFQIDRNDHRKPKLTVAGLLFLGRLDAICQKFPQFHLEYINKRNLRDNERWKDRISSGDLNYMDLNIFEFFKLAWEKLKATIEDPFELDENSVRKSPAELGTTLREALANMLIHADYFDEGELKIIVDNYFYLFSNPGNMRVSTAQFFAGGRSSPRNNTLITFFRRIGISDRAGTGGKVIFNFAKINKYAMPNLITKPWGTSLKIWVATPAESHPEFTKEVQLVFEFIQTYKSVSISQLVKGTSLNRYQIHKSLKQLLGLNYITCSGKGRATKYVWAPTIIEKIAAVDTIRNLIINT